MSVSESIVVGDKGVSVPLAFQCIYECSDVRSENGDREEKRE